MNRAAGLFHGDLRHIRGSREDEIGMINSVLPAISHPDDEWLEWTFMQQLPDSLFHILSLAVNPDNATKSKGEPDYDNDSCGNPTYRLRRFESGLGLGSAICQNWARHQP